MSLELIYTSASRGLKPGSSGFCTVASTGGMSRQISTKLEMLSGYEFAFRISDPKVRLSPVNYAHTRISTSPETKSVLSRIGFAGSDYSGRANKIAHHFMLHPTEHLPNGPAWMLEQLQNKSIFKSCWDEESRELPERHFGKMLVDSVEHSSQVAANWQQMTGDAGWAGILTKSYVDNSKTPAYVIFKPGQDILSLFKESLALLPLSERWKVCFATYYTVLPAGCHYHWRGVLAGSTAWKEISRFPNATLIDLTKPLAKARDNAYSIAAREGGIVAFREAGQPPSEREQIDYEEKENDRERSPHTPRIQSTTSEKMIDISGLAEGALISPNINNRAGLFTKENKLIISLSAATLVVLISLIVLTARLFTAKHRNSPGIENTQTYEGDPKPPSGGKASDLPKDPNDRVNTPQTDNKKKEEYFDKYSLAKYETTIIYRGGNDSLPREIVFSMRDFEIAELNFRLPPKNPDELEYKLTNEELIITCKPKSGFGERPILAKCRINNGQLECDLGEQPWDDREKQQEERYYLPLAKNLVFELIDESRKRIYKCAVRTKPSDLRIDLNDFGEFDPDNFLNAKTVSQLPDILRNMLTYPRSWQLKVIASPDNMTFVKYANIKDNIKRSKKVIQQASVRSPEIKVESENEKHKLEKIKEPNPRIVIEDVWGVKIADIKCE